MNFFTSEQRADIAQFDELIQNTDNALKTPSVVRTLGNLAGQLRAVNNAAFLPNRKHSELRVPRNQAHNANLAIITMSDWEADNAFGLIEPLYDDWPLSWPVRPSFASRAYGITLHSNEIFDWMHDGPSGEANSTIRRGLRRGAIARTQALFDTDKKNRNFIGSRPVLMLRTSNIEPDGWSRAATIAHEEVHALDIVEDGPMYGTLIHGAASELRAYHVSATMYNHTRHESINSDSSYRIESLRQYAVGHTSRPFVPTKWLFDEMVAMGTI